MTITHDVTKAGTVRLFIYALTGQHIRTLVDGARPAGSYSATWDGTDDSRRDVASGVYLCRMVAGNYSAVRKMVLVRCTDRFRASPVLRCRQDRWKAVS